MKKILIETTSIISTIKLDINNTLLKEYIHMTTTIKYTLYKPDISEHTTLHVQLVVLDNHVKAGSI